MTTECCLFYTNLPSECIFIILQFYDGNLSLAHLRQLSSMTSGLHATIFSYSLRNIPPVCICNSLQSTCSCGREKVPALFYKKMLSKGCSLSREANLHIYSDVSVVYDLAESIRMLIGGCKGTITDLILHITVGVESDDETKNLMESTVDENLTRIKNGGVVGSTCISKLQVHPESFLCDKDIMFPKLQKLLISIEFSKTGNEFYTGSICNSILSIFGFNLHQLSICVCSAKSRMDENRSRVTRWAKDERRKPIFNQKDESKSLFGALCPLLTRIELFGCSIEIFFIQNISDTIFSQSNMNRHVCNKRSENVLQLPTNSICSHAAALATKENLGFNFPSLSTLEIDENFQSADEILSVINFISPTVTSLLLMGNISEYLEDILGFIIADTKGNCKCLEILEIHDSLPWPFCDGINQLEASVANVFLVCPHLKRIVMSTVQVSDAVTLYLSTKSLVVTQQQSKFSTNITNIK